MTLLADGRCSSRSEKIVIRFGTGIIEGWLESPAKTTKGELWGSALDDSPA